jgi:tetratricopeptide (TPR) repeat protein
VIALDRDNNASEAFRHFTAALKLNDNDIAAHLNLARLYASTDQTDLAVGEYNQVLRQQPDHPDAHFGLALIYEHQGDSRAAMREYHLVLAINPDHKLTYLNLGRLHEARNEIDEAITSYRRAITIDPQFVPARLNLALLHYRLGRIEEALDEMRTVTRIDPRNFPAFMNLGAMAATFADQLQEPLQRKQLYTKAAEYLAIAGFLDRTSAEAVCLRGVVLMKHSQLEPKRRALLLISDAIASFRRASDLNPDDASAKEYARSAELERQKRSNQPDP